MTTPDIRSQTEAQIQRQFQLWQEPAYRATQLLRWLYEGRAASWDEMTNLPKTLRQRLSETYSLAWPRTGAAPGRAGHHAKVPLAPGGWRVHRKRAHPRQPSPLRRAERPPHLVRFHPGRLRLRLQVLRQRPGRLEAQLARGGNRQPGPGRGATGGRRRANDQQSGHHGHGRAAGQLRQPAAGPAHPQRALGRRIGARKITVSTSGLAPQIRRLADEPQQFRLAVSLHGATDETRGRIMPVNKKYPLAELAAACEYYQEKKGRMITLEYILIAGVNDGLDQARAAGRAGPAACAPRSI